MGHQPSLPYRGDVLLRHPRLSGDVFLRLRLQGDRPQRCLVAQDGDGPHRRHNHFDVLPRVRRRQVRNKEGASLRLHPSFIGKSPHLRRLVHGASGGTLGQPAPGHPRGNAAGRHRLRDVPAGRLRGSQGGYDREDRSDGLRHAIRIDEPGGLSSHLRLFRQGQGIPGMGHSRSVLGLHLLHPRRPHGVFPHPFQQDLQGGGGERQG